MTATESRKPSVSRKRMVGQALFVIVLLLIARYLWMRDQPERLMNAPIYAYTVSGDYLYLKGAPDSPDMTLPTQPTIQAQSIHGGALRTIAKEDTRYQFLNGMGNGADALRVVAGKIYYAIVPRPQPVKAQPQAATSGRPAGPAPRGENLGAFLLQPKSASGVNTAGQKRVYMDLASPAREIRIRQVAIEGGTPRDAALLRGYGYALVGDHLFWIRSEKWTNVLVTQDNGKGSPTQWFEETADSDLMLTSLADGTTRCIYHGISRAALIAGEAGVTWAQLAPFPGRPTVFYARVSDGSVRALGTPQKNEYPSPVVEAQGRLYWTVVFDQGSSYSVLMGANLDGTGIHEVCKQVNRHPIAYLSLHTYQGNLYGSVVEQRTAKDDPGKQKQYVFRFHPERSDPLEIVHKLPDAVGQAQFDGDYLYFVRGDTQRSLWAALTNDEVGAQVTTSLCRISLDH